MWPGRLDRIKIWVKPVREVQVGSGSEDQIPLVSQDLDNFSFRHRVSRLVQLLKHHAMINYLISLLFIINIVIPLYEGDPRTVKTHFECFFNFSLPIDYIARHLALTMRKLKLVTLLFITLSEALTISWRTLVTK